jgi:amino acid permease
MNTDEKWMSDWKLVGNPTFIDAMAALSTIVFAYAGTPLFFPIAAEMREPRHYTKAMLLCQGVATATYLTVGIIIYYFCGSYVATPALGSAGKTIKKVAYGLALPGLIVGATINTHVSLPYKVYFLMDKVLICSFLGDWKVCVRSNPSRLRASHSKHCHSLGYMVGSYLQHCSVCIHHS